MNLRFSYLHLAIAPLNHILVYALTWISIFKKVRVTNGELI